MSNKDFLLQECENVSKVLKETLRFKYGLEGSKDFYEECELRLNFIKQEINNTDEPDFARLGANFELLEDLSSLISRIERSSRGEYSWPFVEELKKIAAAICTEDTLQSKNNPHKVHVLSEGGLGAYQIFTERKRPTASNKRILTIVFPRTLKHYVLFHPILGHELGHAIWQSSKHQSELKDIVFNGLIQSNGVFSDKRSTASWLYSKNAPREIQDFLNNVLKHNGITEQNFFNWADWDAWVEEILCDLIGLLIFGPSFVAAHCKLLYGISPSGISFSTQHPLVACRVNMVLSAAEILGFDDLSGFPRGDVKNATEKFWGDLRSNVKVDDWFSIFKEGPLKTAVNEIETLLSKNIPSGYTRPAYETLKKLCNQLRKLVPPVGFSMDEEMKPKCCAVDFRHILYAGWIAENSGLDISFYDINRLCEHGIMQQRGIDIFLKATN
jgi:hypothetical protein